MKKRDPCAAKRGREGAIKTFSTSNAERAVIAALLKDAPGHWRAANALRASDFTDALCARVFEKIGLLLAAKAPAGLSNLLDAFPEHLEALTGFIQTSPGAEAMLETNVRAVRDAARRAAFKSLMGNACARADDAALPLDDLVGEVRQGLRELRAEDYDAATQTEAVVQALVEIDDLRTGKNPPISTGFSKLDAITGGLHKGELTIIGARPGVGKTAFAGQLAIAAARNGRNVLLVSLEMRAAELVKRQIQRYTAFRPIRMRNGTLTETEMAQVNDVGVALGPLPIRYLCARYDVEGIVGRVQSYADRGECDLCILDYAQLVGSVLRFPNEYERVSHVSRTLKATAQELQIPIVALAQLSRESAKADKRPELFDLRGSGSLEQDADNVFMLYGIENEESLKTPEARAIFRRVAQARHRFIQLCVRKQRNGSLDSVLLDFDPERMSFADL